MLANKVIVVVIPAYNVEKQIRSAVEELPKFVDHIVVVNDCSTDRTRQNVELISDDRLILLNNEINQGVGGATIEGFKKGMELGGDIFVKYDGDGQMDPYKMEDLIAPLFSGYGYSKGNRFIHTRDLTRKMPKLRLLGNFILTFLTKLASGYWQTFDPQNGYVAITRDALSALDLDAFHKRYFFENEMLIHLNIWQIKVKDVSIPARYGDEKSSLRIWKILFTFPQLLFKRFVLRVYFKYILYDFSVIGVFYVVGSILLIWGTLFGSYAWAKSIFTGVVTTTGTIMIAVLPFIIGFQLFLQAIVMEVQQADNLER